nr:MAG TPA: hypothetical protein [Caudoviricetes sp.]
MEALRSLYLRYSLCLYENKGQHVYNHQLWVGYK